MVGDTQVRGHDCSVKGSRSLSLAMGLEQTHGDADQLVALLFEQSSGNR
jgi:hypothetical protein